MDTTPRSAQLPVLGFQALRPFGSRQPQLLDYSETGDFWYPGWNQGSYIAWNTRELAEAANVINLDPGTYQPLHLPGVHAPILVVMAGLGEVEIKTGLLWHADYVRIEAIVDDHPTPFVEAIATYYCVPILARNPPLPTTIKGQSFPGLTNLEFKASQALVAFPDLFLGLLGTLLVALGFGGVHLGQVSLGLAFVGMGLVLAFLTVFLIKKHRTSPILRLHLSEPNPATITPPDPFRSQPFAYLGFTS